MSKTKTKATSTVAPAAAAPAAPKVATLQVRKGMQYRGARAAWYERLCEYDGKPVAEFVASATANPPSVYGSRSKHAGKPEPVPGWLRFFVRTGVAELV
jgi:hypothetical protein